MKTKITATVTALLTAALTLLSPATAFAAPLAPDGSVNYGPNTVCSFWGNSEEPIVAETNCQAIPTFQWDAEPFQAPTDSQFLTTVSVGSLDWIGTVGSEGSTHQGDPDTLSNLFYVDPDPVTSTPFIGQTSVNLFGHNPEAIAIENVTVTFVTNNNLIAEREPFTGNPGSRSELQSNGTSKSLPVTATSDGNYDVALELPTPTWSWSTDGTLNAYGWSGELVTVVTGTVDGEPATQVTRQGLTVNSGLLHDIQGFYDETIFEGNTVGTSVSSYQLFVETFTVTEPPVVTPPVVVPPVVTPPVVVTPEPVVPERPEIRTGGYTQELPTVLYLVPVALFLLGFAFVAVLPRIKNEEQAG